MSEKFLNRKVAFKCDETKVNLAMEKVMLSSPKRQKLKSKINPFVKCGKVVMANVILCSNCGKWIQGRSGKRKKVFSAVAKDFVCGRWFETRKGIMKLHEKIAFCDLVKYAKSFCYLGDSLNTSGENEAAATVKTRIG